jgi:RNA polymerase sigma factor (sigma-70 family)
MREMGQVDDAELCARYVRQRDEAAFELIVRRHGPLVLRVCRHVLQNEQDIEDAFQATFLVLVRRLGQLRSPGGLANWLFGVARRTALAAKRNALNRRAKEARARVPDRPADDREAVWSMLCQGIERLPDKYRLPILLCDLEGKTRQEVARQLGWAEGTVASRVARGRRLLAGRLARGGFGASAVVGALVGEVASAALRPGLVASTVAAAGYTTAREAVASGVLSGGVAALTEGAVRSMLYSKIKVVAAWLIVVGVTTIGGGGLIAQDSRPELDKPSAQAGDRDVPERSHDLGRQVNELQDRVTRLEQAARTVPGRDTFLDRRFKHKVDVEIGATESAHGGRIEITEVWGTRPRIEIGGMYVVRGRYRLPPGVRGRIYFYETTTGDWGSRGSPTMDLQSADVDGESGEFELMNGMGGPGWFHLYLQGRTGPPVFANVYFGTGDNVLRKKTW